MRSEALQALIDEYEHAPDVQKIPSQQLRRKPLTAESFGTVTLVNINIRYS